MLFKAGLTVTKNQWKIAETIYTSFLKVNFWTTLTASCDIYKWQLWKNFFWIDRQIFQFGFRASRWKKLRGIFSLTILFSNQNRPCNINNYLWQTTVIVSTVCVLFFSVVFLCHIQFVMIISLSKENSSCLLSELIM
jgi:hypothetical protein